MANIKTYYDTAVELTGPVLDNNIIVVQTASDSSLATMAKTTVGNLHLSLTEVDASLAASIASEASRASASEASLAGAISAEISRATDAESSLTSAITSTIGELNSDTAGGNGKYIESISEASGIISPVEANLATNLEASGVDSKAPAVSGVKNYVAGRISNLSGSVGGATKLVQQVVENNGSITGTTIDLEDSLSSSASAVPTSSAVYNKIAGLAGSVGGTGKLVQQVIESDGSITGTTVDITTSIDESSNIPTSKAVYDKVQNDLDMAIGALDQAEVGSDGNYIKTVKQIDGQLYATKQAFDTAINSSSANNNAPTSLAVKTYVDNSTSNINTRINGLNYSHASTATGTGDGYFIQQVNEASGVISASKVKFYDQALASYGASATGSSYANSTVVAPNVKVVADQIKRLDARIDSANAGVTALSTGPFGSVGAYISEVSQSAGYLQASSKAFLTTIPATTGASGATEPPTADAVRKAINALNATATGSTGSYIRYIQESSGVVSATAAAFDTTVGTATGAGAATNDNSPTSLAVRTAIENAKIEILEQSEAMTYRGSVSSVTDIQNKASQAHSAQTDKYVVGDTYISSGTFNLDGTADPAYQVNSGDMLIVNSNAVSFNKNNFDIIAGSTKSVLYASNVAVVNNIPIFSTTDGRSIIDSGESITTLSSRQNAASLSASYSASYAQNASDAASFAEYEVQPYISSAACAASYAAGYRNDASLAASYAASYAVEAGTIAAVDAEEAASRASTAAEAAEGAQGRAESAETAAVNAKTGAQDSSSVALAAKDDAQGYACSASLSLTATTGYEEAASLSAYAASSEATRASKNADAAYSAASLATDYRNTASLAAASATDYRNTASTAASLTTGYRNTASTAAAAATGYENAALTAKTKTVDYEGQAEQAALNAQAYASAANLSSIASAASTAASNALTYKNAAACSASYASSSANVAGEAATSAVNTAIAGIISSATGETSKTITSISQASGIVSATWSNISISESQVSGLTNDLASKLTGISSTSSGTGGVVTNVSASGSTVTVTKSNDISVNSLTASGSISANDFTATSSRKLKENIRPTVVSALNLIDSVNIVDFNYIADSKKVPHIGFIAEDTDDLLSTPEKNKMDYTNCIGTLLKAVQEITAGMKVLEDKIEKLEK